MARRSSKLFPAVVFIATLSTVVQIDNLVLPFGSRVFLSPSSPPPRADSRVKMYGVTKEVIKEGTDETVVKSGDKVTVNYRGTCGGVAGFFKTQFDSSYDRGVPYTFTVGQSKVIKGWTEGVPGMRLGEKAVLEITSDYAYGEREKPGIPPNSDLTFEIEILNIETPNFVESLFR